MNSKYERDTSKDIIRVIAIILIVLGHSMYSEMTTPVGHISLKLENVSNAYNLFDGFYWLIMNWIAYFHLQLFFALAGSVHYLATIRNGNITFDSLIEKKFFRLLIPYFFWGMAFVIPIKLVSGYYQPENIPTVMNSYLTTAEGAHTWFLIALFWCFIIFYLLNKYVTRGSIAGLIIVAIIINQFYSSLPFDIFLLKVSLSYLRHHQYV